MNEGFNTMLTALIVTLNARISEQNIPKQSTDRYPTKIHQIVISQNAIHLVNGTSSFRVGKIGRTDTNME